LASDESVRVWYDSEGDYLEVNFTNAPGTFEETGDDRVMVKIDQAGRILGFSILNVSQLQGKPIDVSLSAA